MGFGAKNKACSLYFQKTQKGSDSYFSEWDPHFGGVHWVTETSESADVTTDVVVVTVANVTWH